MKRSFSEVEAEPEEQQQEVPQEPGGPDGPGRPQEAAGEAPSAFRALWSPTFVTAGAHGPEVRHLGTVRWYNGRRRLGKVIPDGGGGGDLFIPAQGAPNGSRVPPQPGGLFHGTRVSYLPVALASEPASGVRSSPGGAATVCMDVRPVPGQVGLSCGVDTDRGAKEQNDDRIAAADLEELGFFCGVFDGHRGCECANAVAQGLPGAVLAEFRKRSSKRGGGVAAASLQQEVSMISGALADAFEATDRAFLQAARKKDLIDGSTAVVALLSHGFEAPAAQPTGGGEGGPPPPAAERGTGTAPAAPGGVAKLFVAWCGDSRAVLLRGRQGLRISEDHKPARADEQERVRRAGGRVMRDAWGTLRVGPKEENALVRELQKGRKADAEVMKWFLSTSRAFGDAELKVPDPIVVSTPDIRVVDLVPEDWAVVLGCDGIFDHLSDQEVADAVWRCMGADGKDVIAAAKAVVQAALQSGSKDNLTSVVMRLGWSPIPTANASSCAGGAPLEPPPALQEVDMFG